MHRLLSPIRSLIRARGQDPSRLPGLRRCADELELHAGVYAVTEDAEKKRLGIKVRNKLNIKPEPATL